MPSHRIFPVAWIVLLISRGHRANPRRLGHDLDVLAPWTGGGKAFPEGQEQLGLPPDTDLSCDQRGDEMSLLREEPEPGRCIGREWTSPLPTRPSAISSVRCRIVKVASRLSAPVNVKWKVASSPRDWLGWKTYGMKLINPAIERGRSPLLTGFTVLFLNFRRAIASASGPGRHRRVRRAPAGASPPR